MCLLSLHLSVKTFYLSKSIKLIVHYSLHWFWITVEHWIVYSLGFRFNTIRIMVLIAVSMK